MNPTPRLRFVERTVELSPFYMTINANGETTRGAHKYHILQQWWALERAGQITPTGEWRDVPLEKENE